MTDGWIYSFQMIRSRIFCLSIVKENALTRSASRREWGMAREARYGRGWEWIQLTLTKTDGWICLSLTWITRCTHSIKTSTTKVLTIKQFRPALDEPPR